MSQATDSDTTRDADRAWKLMKKIGLAMLVTRDDDRLRAQRHEDEEIARNPSINISFADANGQKIAI
jgi:hypothetical protein